ncbi:MAG: DUF997 family protein [Shewanella sp.]|uniref:DUF997 family protein n=1 Tax=Shewanella sp. SNU WT4 TaxID=2590015 RepID=UPI00112A6109|nr:DUF997 family protein [Shewanella sp. SNU WT4]QDF67460.1 DUF997 family protein [Shewanella sp. SNU WT4]
MFSSSLAKRVTPAVIILCLALGYFLVWAFGPLFLSERGSWLGMPLWFWCSCVAAPLLLLAALAAINHQSADTNHGGNEL